MMKKNWFDSKVQEFSSIGGYQKPELNENSLKLDSNENYVLSKQFQNDIVSGARKNSDVREYPLGGVERLIQMISKFVKVPSSMIGIGNGSDQILDLILSNFASKQTKVLTSNPTFGFFEERCKLYSIPLILHAFYKISHDSNTRNRVHFCVEMNPRRAPLPSRITGTKESSGQFHCSPEEGHLGVDTRRSAPAREIRTARSGVGG